MQKDFHTVRPWEAAALIALCIALCHGSVQARQLDRLSENVVRLHVIAVSDEDEEQRVKRQVRDAVRPLLEELLDGCGTAEDAAARIETHTELIRSAAIAAAEGREVAVDFGPVSYPLREGDGYVLPAGTYRSLRITLGDGQGHNWWGVLFPELTMDPGESYEDAAKILGEDTLRLVTEEGRVCVRFRTLELLARLRALFSR